MRRLLAWWRRRRTARDPDTLTLRVRSDEELEQAIELAQSRTGSTRILIPPGACLHRAPWALPPREGRGEITIEPDA